MVRGSIALLALTGVLAGCSTVPGDGPSVADIVQPAPAGAEASAPKLYEVVDLSPDVIRVVKRRPLDGFSAHFGDKRPSADLRIGVGDTVAVTVWEAGSNGLFSASSLSTTHFSTGANSSSIPVQAVGRDGTITVPYAGRVYAQGKTTETLQDDIRKALAGRAIQPQVLVNLVKSVSNLVTVGGESTASARVPLTPKGDRILDVIAEAGNALAPLANPSQVSLGLPTLNSLSTTNAVLSTVTDSQKVASGLGAVNATKVRLSRGSTTVSVPLTRVVADPRENIYVQPGDTLTLISDPEAYLVLGATGVSQKISFGADSISLLEAIAKVGGLQDSQANPSGVFVFRYEPLVVARALRPASAFNARSWVPVVYHLDMRDAASLFLAQGFTMFNKDIVYVSTAPIVDAQKVMQIFNTVSGPLDSGASLAVALR